MRGLAEPLRAPPFRLLFLARVVSVLGDGIAPVALAFAVLDLSGSAGDLGLALGARTVTLILFSLVGGVWGDRLPRHLVMVGAHVVRFAGQATLATLLLSGAARVWQVVALQALNGAAAAFFQPALAGLTPRLVPREQLQQANALASLSLSAVRILGPVAGGVLVAAVGSGWAIAADAATFAIAALLLLRLRLPPRERAQPTRFLADLVVGWTEVRRRSWVWISIVASSVWQLVFYSAFGVVGPLIAKRSLGGASAWGLVVAGFGLGAVLGGAAALRYRPSRPLVAAHGAAIGLAPGFTALAAALPAPIVAAAFVPAGAAAAFGGTIWDTTLQQRVPDAVLARVSSYDWLGSFALRPLGYAAIGPLVSVAGARTTVLGAAAASVALAFATVAAPPIRRLRRDEQAAEAPAAG